MNSFAEKNMVPLYAKVEVPKIEIPFEKGQDIGSDFLLPSIVSNEQFHMVKT